MARAGRDLQFVPSEVQCRSRSDDESNQTNHQLTSKDSIMNRHFALFLVVAAAAAGNAFADDITMDPPFTSTLSRAQVQAELKQFRSSGVDPWSQSYDQLAAFRSERSRAQVSAEYIADRHQVAGLHGEDGGSMQLARRDAPQPVAHIASSAAAE